MLILDAGLIFRMPGSIDIGGPLCWPAARGARGPVGPRLAITICLFSSFFFDLFSFSLSNIFSNGAHNVRPLELRPQGKSNFR